MIYLDSAATTKLDNSLHEVMHKYFCADFFNPSASYDEGVKIKNDIIEQKKSIRNSLYADNYDIIFVGSATEGNNLAFLGQLNKRYKKVLISKQEHASVFECTKRAKELGYIVDFIDNEVDGSISISSLKDKLDENVGMVYCIHVSNETGVINDIAALSNTVKTFNNNILFCVDGVQAYKKIDVNLDKLNIDSYVISAHKINGPKGIGAVIFKKNSQIKPIIFGGGQENNLRSGTENVAFIAALAQLANKNVFDINKIKELNNRLISNLNDEEGISCNFVSSNKSPFIQSVTFNGVNGETLMHILNDKGVICSTGSACSSNKGNRVLNEMLNKKNVLASLRFSFGKDNTVEEIDEACRIIIECYRNLRKNKVGR